MLRRAAIRRALIRVCFSSLSETQPQIEPNAMGKLLSLLARDDSSCCTPKSYDVFLDFENAAPTETEKAVYDEVERVLRESENVLEEIQCYKVRWVLR